MNIKIESNKIYLKLASKTMDRSDYELERNFIENILGIKKKDDTCICKTDVDSFGDIIGLELLKGDNQ
jgi:hypothetical protein